MDRRRKVEVFEQIRREHAHGAVTMSNCQAANSPMGYTTAPTEEEESGFYPYGGEMKLCDRVPQNYKFTGSQRDRRASYVVSWHHAAATNNEYH